MADITIPPKALEAAYDARRNGDRLEDICLAMLKNWPGSYSLAENDSADIRGVAAIILPLPKENTNAEA